MPEFDDSLKLADKLNANDLEKIDQDWILAIHDSRMSHSSKNNTHSKIIAQCELFNSMTTDDKEKALLALNSSGDRDAKEFALLIREIASKPDLISTLKKDRLHPIWLKFHRKAVEERKNDTPEQYRLQLNVAISRRNLEKFLQSKSTKDASEKETFLVLTRTIKELISSFSEVIKIDSEKTTDEEIIQKMKKIFDSPTFPNQADAVVFEKSLQDKDLLPFLKEYIRAELALMSFDMDKK